MLAKRFNFARTLHGRLLLALLLIGIIPLGLIGLGISVLDRRSIGEQSARELIGLARGLAGQLHVHVTGLLENARAISALPEITGMDRARQSALLKELFLHYPTFARLSVFDRTGRRVASSHVGGAPSIAARKSFQTAIGRGHQSWEVAHALTTGRSSLLIHTPIRDAERRVVGVLGAVVDLEDISVAVNRVHVGGGGQAFVLDAAGRVLLHREKAAVQKRLDYSWIGISVGGRLAGPGTVRYDAAGESRIAGYAAIPDTGWTVVVERPEADILIPGKRSFRLALTGLAISVALALSAGAFFALKLTRPVRELTRAAQGLAAGDRSLPLPSIAENESDVGVLIAAFDAMRKAVETREAALRGSLERIRVLREIDTAITSTLDLATVLDLLLEKIDSLLPYDASAILLLNKESGELESAAFRNIAEEKWKEHIARIRSGDSLARRVVETRLPFVIGKVQSDTRTRDQEFFIEQGFVSYLSIPLMYKGEALGVLALYTKEERAFSNEEIEFISTLAAQAAMAIHNSQLYEEMVKLAGDLSRSNKVKDEFLSVMSHELRTPLNVVLGYTGMIKDRILGEISPEQARALDKVTNHSRDLLAMISGILEATHIEAEGVRVERNEVNLVGFLDELKLAYNVPSDKKLELIWNYPSDLPVIKTDSEKLGRILRNLVNNAIKFTEKGSVTISAACLFLNPSSRVVEFKVADTGIGIAKEFLPLIFEKFRQVDSSETRPYGGMGLGLYIVKKYTELLGGAVEVESEPGQGSTFTVTFPCEITEEPPQTVQTEAHGGAHMKKRILLVEDNPATIEVVGQELEFLGYEVAVAKNGLEAAKMAESYLPDLILMDILMPTMGGLEAVSRIRRDPKTSSIPVLACTAKALPGDKETCLRGGCDDYIAKPFTHRELGAAIEKLLTKRSGKIS